MALKGKSKRSVRSGGAKVARAPRATAQRRQPKWTDRITAVTVLGAAFVVVMVGVVLWAVISTIVPDPVPGLTEYSESTAEATTDLGSAATELSGWSSSVADGSGNVARVVDSATGRIPTIESDVSTVRRAPSSSEVALAKTSQMTSGQLLGEGAATLTWMKDRDVALSAAIARRAGRVGQIASALLSTGNGLITGLENNANFRSSTDDVADPIPNDPFAPVAPLDGLGRAADGSPPDESPPKVNTSTQSDDEYAKQVAPIFAKLDTSIANMNEVVNTEYAAGGDATKLNEAAIAWATAIETAIREIDETARPETVQGADAVLRNVLWIYLESAQSFASVSTAPELEVDLVESGKVLRLLGDQARASGKGTLLRVAGVSIPAAPVSGFDPTLIDPSAVPPPASGLPQGLPPGVEIPGSDFSTTP